MLHINDRLVQASFNSSGRTGQPSAETASLFAYGTLTIDEVIAVLLDRVPTHYMAEAAGWRAVRLPERMYPGLVWSNHQVACGRVYTGLTVEEWLTLDDFEDPAYQLRRVEVFPSATFPLAYVWPTVHDNTPWRVNDLSQQQLAEYLDLCSRWRLRHRRTRKL